MRYGLETRRSDVAVTPLNRQRTFWSPRLSFGLDSLKIVLQYFITNLWSVTVQTCYH